jgi:hypothetical protein
MHTFEKLVREAEQNETSWDSFSGLAMAMA